MKRFLSFGIATAVTIAVFSLSAPLWVAVPVIHVQPYVQPGNGYVLTGTDVKVIHWLTDQTPGNFVVEYWGNQGVVQSAESTYVRLDFPAPCTETEIKEKDKGTEPPHSPEDEEEPKAAAPKEKDQYYLRYTAKLDNLPFNSDITYRVRLGNRIIRQATFRTRTTQDQAVRCVLVGDLAQGWQAQNEIAYRVSLEKPEFLVALGDIVYPTGRVSEYAASYWGTYNNVAAAGLKTGAPLMASVPFYPVLGNHDVYSKPTKTTPDGLAAYYFFSPPKNGPGEGPWNTQLDVADPFTAQFRAATADSFPFVDTYSFDNGPAHFVVINTNRPLTLPAFQKWLIDDLQSTQAKWKIVCFHIPGFQSSYWHYSEQQVRQLQPIFEACGVDLTFGGHVHNYQRSVPLKFVPKTVAPGPVAWSRTLLVNGVFRLDTKFDGLKNTRADGVIHIVAGGGGAYLYGPALEENAAWLKRYYDADNYVDFTARMVVDRHSFVVLDIAPQRLDLRAIGASGDELDRISLTKDR